MHEKAHVIPASISYPRHDKGVNFPSTVIIPYFTTSSFSCCHLVQLLASISSITNSAEAQVAPRGYFPGSYILFKYPSDCLDSSAWRMSKGNARASIAQIMLKTCNAHHVKNSGLRTAFSVRKTASKRIGYQSHCFPL